MLQSPASSATSNGMSEVDAKIAAAEARTDTKFAQVMGELRLINQRLEHVEGYTRNLRSTVIGTGIAAVALVVGIFGWGASMFGVGMDAQSIANQSAKNVVELAQP